MRQLIRLLKVDIMKLKSSQIFWLHLYLPAIGASLFVAYYGVSHWDAFTMVSTYFQALCIVFPILIGVVTSLVASQEGSAGEFQQMLTTSNPKVLTMVSKLLILLALGLVATSLAVIGFYLGLLTVKGVSYPITINFAVIGLMLVTNIFQYMLHCFLSFRLSSGISIGVGVVESLICALFLTGMGDGRWPFAPSSWSVRFISSFLLNSFTQEVGPQDPDLLLGMISLLVVTGLGILALSFWFNRWEGHQIEE